LPFPPPILLRFLDRTRLAEPLFRLYEAIAALRPTLTPAGIVQPLPPASLRFKVAGTPRAFSYVDGGRKAVQSIEEILTAGGRSLSECQSILEFGCGCGRVLTHFECDASLAGCDINQQLIDWVHEYLPSIDARVNGLQPPLSWPDSAFDLVVALSVFTHLPEPLALAWMAELIRVLAPGGYIVFSAHGEHYLPALTASERADFKAGKPVARFARSAGTNLCNTYYPESWVRKTLASGLESAAFRARGAHGNPEQDLYLFKKPLIP
jgi:SAM-dependent methyltransferase